MRCFGFCFVLVFCCTITHLYIVHQFRCGTEGGSFYSLLLVVQKPTFDFLFVLGHYLAAAA